MDAGHKSNRRFPSYTTAELEAILSSAKVVVTPQYRRQIEAEVAARKAGKSKPFSVPQITA